MKQKSFCRACNTSAVFEAIIKPVHPCTGLIARFAEQNALLHFVFFEVIVNKMQQSAKERCLLKRQTMSEVFPLTIGSGKTRPFEKRRSRYKETAENKAEAYRVYVEHLFSACDAVDARIFSKGNGNMRKRACQENCVNGYVRISRLEPVCQIVWLA